MAAQDSSESPGIFNSLAVGVSASTTGIGIDVASPIGSYLAVRAGVSFMPNFTYSTDVDVDIEGSYEGNIPTSIDVEGGMGRMKNPNRNAQFCMFHYWQEQSFIEGKN